MTDTHRYCVIMCGGIGSRFWPSSRASRPKQFLDFLGTGRSLLQMSYDRMRPLVEPSHVIVVTNEAYAPLVAEQLPELKPDQILCEPARRNTAPAIAWAAYHIRALDPDAVMAVLPSDHLITSEAVFVECLERAFNFVTDHDALLTLGISPSRPETGYGYIQAGEPTDVPGINRVKTFTEKPNRELAEVFLSTGEFFWNSGIFVWKARDIIRALEETAPDLALVFDGGKEFYGTPAEKEFVAEHFPCCIGISIDYAVMERAKNVYVETVDFGWSDLGTWGSLYDVSPKRPDRNVTQRCKVMAYNAEGNIFAVKGDKLVVAAGLRDYIIADTGDVLLIYPRAEEQQLRQVVNDVKAAFGDKYL